MTKQDALKLLNLKQDYTEKDLVQAYERAGCQKDIKYKLASEALSILCSTNKSLVLISKNGERTFGRMFYSGVEFVKQGALGNMIIWSFKALFVMALLVGGAIFLNPLNKTLVIVALALIVCISYCIANALRELANLATATSGGLESWLRGGIPNFPKPVPLWMLRIAPEFRHLDSRLVLEEASAIKITKLAHIFYYPVGRKMLSEHSKRFKYLANKFLEEWEAPSAEVAKSKAKPAPKTKKG